MVGRGQDALGAFERLRRSRSLSYSPQRLSARFGHLVHSRSRGCHAAESDRMSKQEIDVQIWRQHPCQNGLSTLVLQVLRLVS